MNASDLDKIPLSQWNALIAEKCGWKWELPFNKRKAKNRLVSPDKKHVCFVWRDGSTGGTGLPSYLSDLNACAQFEATLTDEQWEFYTNHILSDYGERPRFSPFYDVAKTLLSATSEQRCRAFLLTV